MVKKPTTKPDPGKELANYVTKKVKSLISKLPKKAEEIREFLQKQGYKGKRASRAECPIANYLKSNLCKEAHVEVGPLILYVDIESCNYSLSLDLPVKVRKFIIAFDDNHYKELKGRCRVKYNQDPKLEELLTKYKKTLASKS
ncbi:MAG: hypothetical protein KatS3mg087_2076 [Patescibacteria group bacterium]|nr:MAG: hypothetical protein KatS3mg087_2076 [Patescibacteria group bacterium]